MKKFLQTLTTLSLTNLALTGLALALPSSAVALTEDQILEKLSSIPVFLVVNGEGRSLTARVTAADDRQVEVPLVFIHSAEALAFIEDAEADRPDFANQARIAVLPLSEVYAEASTQLNSPNSLVYIPSADSMSQAAQIVNQDIEGVPLYAAVDLEQDRYLLTAQNELPMFFSLADLQTQLQALVANNPGIEDSIGVEVITFETVLDNMGSDNPELDQLMELVEFVPSSQTLEYLQSLTQEGAAER